ncbi:hypothetical protein [Pararobbsia alpina]|uniref:Uncharacterized protein n=1 Tax=Pararobbsia alpina TaxID=621374 RepID=A0A6S7D7J7_9BURK|nr:hypothetical protein [Pararobbsia alpina]CAB3798025.1 hypothetical protein LMG28138_04362 [Pararobbsia alpina]
MSRRCWFAQTDAMECRILEIALRRLEKVDAELEQELVGSTRHERERLQQVIEKARAVLKVE